ncbi:MAG: 2-oxoacid:ferredoxin oxidoreductase subunit beta [Phycisphaeraceae bacterium]
MASSDVGLTVLKPKDFASDQEVRWCPGCGDYAILTQVRKLLAKMQARKERTVFVAGIGCSSRFPYYLDTYGLHSIHGRAPGFATGVKMTNPDLDVWMITGDGDALSIGGNHLLHILRRNVNVNILLFNNRIYGLTKGQYSPTSEVSKKTKSSPMGSLDAPLHPISVAVAAEASFVARSIDIDKGLGDVLERAAKHQGTSFVEIYQDCNVFNHKAFAYATDKDAKEDNILRLEHGKPMIFGNEADKGIRLAGDGKPEVVTLGNGIQEDDLLFHDEADASLAFMLSRMSHPDFPEPMGVFRAVDVPCYDQMVQQQVADAIAAKGPGDLRKLLHAGDTWDVKNPHEGVQTEALHR